MNQRPNLLNLNVAKDDAFERRLGSSVQFSTFLVSGRHYGIDVTRVQEIVRPIPMTKVPLAPFFVRGLINLRGQVATAIGLRELFNLQTEAPDQLMNVVCKHGGSLLSLLVDDIGDVVEAAQADAERVPSTVPNDIRRFLSGVFKVQGVLLSIIDMDQVAKFLGTENQD